MKAGDIVYLTKYALSSKGKITTHTVKSISESGLYRSLLPATRHGRD